VKTVLFYSSEFLPFKGGVARCAADMAAMMADGAFARVAVLTETADRGGHPELTLPYAVHRLPSKRFGRPWLNLGVNAVSSLAVVLCARLRRFEWLIVTGKRSVYNAAFFRSFLRHMKVVVVLHGSEWADIAEAKGFKATLLRRAFLRLCESGHVVVIHNRFTARRFHTLPGYPTSKTRVLPPVVDLDRVRVDERLVDSYRRRYFGEPAFSLVTVARLTPRKGQDHVLRALGRMKREGNESFRYFIIGRGWYKPRLKHLVAAEGLEDRVVMLDDLDDGAAFSLVSLCDLFVMPNREYEGTVEGFGIAFLEANVLGVPVLAGNSGGSPEAVQDGVNGLICDGNDPEDIHRKIRLYLDDVALRARLRSGCRDHVVKCFSLGRWQPEYQALLGEPVTSA